MCAPTPSPKIKNTQTIVGGGSRFQAVVSATIKANSQPAQTADNQRASSSEDQENLSDDFNGQVLQQVRACTDQRNLNIP